MKKNVFIEKSGCLGTKGGVFSLISVGILVAAPIVSTMENRTAVEITVYNSSLGLVKETRSVQLPQGISELLFADVAASIMPATVHVASKGKAGIFSVIEQNYEYDLIDQDKLLDKYVGKKIKLIDWNPYKDKKEIVDALLLGNNNGQVFEIDGEIYLGHPGYKIVPEIPRNLSAKPTLAWLCESSAGKKHTLEVAYLTRDITWQADYVLVLGADDASAELSGWVTVDNRCGATYENARLKLVAGDVNRVMKPSLRSFETDQAVMTKALRAPSFEEKEFFEYHVYDLQRATTIKDRQTKQIRLLDAAIREITKEFVVRGRNHFFLSRFRDDQAKEPVGVYLRFNNKKENGLGMPLPEGAMRVYKNDDSGRQFAGEDRIQHTPKNEEISLKMGSAFDIVAERRQVDFKQAGSRTSESAWEIVIRNHKKEKVTVAVVEPLQGSWKVMEKSHPFIKVDAFTIRFDVPVAADGETKVAYRIEVRQ